MPLHGEVRFGSKCEELNLSKSSPLYPTFRTSTRRVDTSITAAIAPSIRPASSLPALVSIFPCRLDAQCQSSAADPYDGERILTEGGCDTRLTRPRHADDIDAGSLTSFAISHRRYRRARRLRVPHKPCPMISPHRQCRSWPKQATYSQPPQEIRA